MSADALARFQALLAGAATEGALVKLTLGKPRPGAADPTLRNVFVRPVALKTGPHLSLVFRHATRDVTKNLPPAEAVAAVERMLAEDFLDAHLFTSLHTAQLEQSADAARPPRLRVKTADAAPPIRQATHDRAKTRVLAPDSPWLRALGVTNDRGQPREGMAHKFRQIEKFAELLQSLLTEAGFDTSSPSASDAAPTSPAAPPLRIADMGAGKGYLTFALAALLGRSARITGIERRADLVATCNRVAAECGFAAHLNFVQGDIPATPESARSALGELDVLIALHACDTATDDALAAGHAAGARLLVVSPCCQKELRAQLTAPAVLADALRHGIFQERQAEFVTDALRAQLLEAAGYRSKVFEFISTEHTAKNLMIAAVRQRETPARAALARARDFAAFYGIREQRLARHLGLNLTVI
jgi:SAM-dependent methyltransferase